MAESFLNALVGGYQFGAQVKQGRDRQQLNALAGQAYNTAPDQQQGLLSQMAGIDPGAAQAQQKQFQGDEDRRNTTMANMARVLTTAPEQARAGLYQRMLPSLQQFGMTGMPEAYTPETSGPIMQAAKSIAQASIGGGASGIQSTYIDAQGNRVAVMRNGSSQIIGQNAPNNQIIDTGNGFYGVNKGNLNAAPVNIGGQQTPQQRAPGEVPFSIDPSLPQEVQASIRGNESAYANAPDGSQMQIGPQTPSNAGQQLRSAPKPQTAPAGYSVLPDGTMEAIPGGPADIAIQARNDAAAAKQVALDAKNAQAAQASQRRQAASTEAAQSLIDAIDRVTNSRGFADLGTLTGDAKIAIPGFRNDAKDAQGNLDNVSGQVALASMASLRALSSQGATGFGALSAPELRLLQNSLAAIDAGQLSNAQLASNLKIVRDKMQKIVDWKPSQETDSTRTAPTDSAPQQAPASGGVDDLLGKYGIR